MLEISTLLHNNDKLLAISNFIIILTNCLHSSIDYRSPLIKCMLPLINYHRLYEFHHWYYRWPAACYHWSTTHYCCVINHRLPLISCIIPLIIIDQHLVITDPLWISYTSSLITLHYHWQTLGLTFSRWERPSKNCRRYQSPHTVGEMLYKARANGYKYSHSNITIVVFLWPWIYLQLLHLSPSGS